MAWSSMITMSRRSGRYALARLSHHICRLGADCRGVTGVQYAMVLPALVGVIMGTIDMGRMMMAQNTLVHAANEATRFAMVRSATSDHVASEDDIIALVKGSMTGLNASHAVVSVNWIPENQPGARVTVDIDYPYNLSAMGTVNLKGSSSNFVTH